MNRPTICCAIIARNERRDLPKLLKSLIGVADRIVIVDTGSTDGGITAAMDGFEGTAQVTSDLYLDACEPHPDKPREYRIVNFAKARNHALELAEATGCSYIMWMDADDILMTPLAMRRAAYMPDAVIGCWVELGGTRQLSHRMWPAKYKVRFEGWVHEFPVVHKFPGIALQDCYIQHDATPHESAGEDSNARNLRILTAQWKAEPDARCAFYLANTHKDGGRYEQAVEWYRKRLEYGSAWRDEYLFARLYLARSLADMGRYSEATGEALAGLEEAPDWQEFRMLMAWIHYKQKNYRSAIVYAEGSLDKPIPESILWREKSMYRDQPARLISWCHEHLGNLSQAFVWSQLASRLIGHYDADWDKRERVLEQRLGAPIPQAPAIVKGLRPKIALHRPGAIGDILMTLNLIPAFKEANPGVDVHYFCDARLGAPDALGQIMLEAGVDMVMDSAQLEPWRKSYERVIDLVGYPLAEGYPEKPMARHLFSYFAEELGLLHRMPLDGHGLPSLTVRRPSKPELPWMKRPYATFQPRAGWSKYKQWPMDNWMVAQTILLADPDIVFYAIDERINQKPLSHAIAVFANARMHIGIDSFCNHLTNYTWTYPGGGRKVPGVILWGSTQASAAGYPHNTNISKGLSCQPCFRENPAISRQPRGPCVNVRSLVAIDGRAGGGSYFENVPATSYDDPRPHACMDAISVEEVVDAVRTMWNQTAP